MRERYLLPFLSMLLVCWWLPAESPAPTSPEPSSEQPMVLLSICEAELTLLEQTAKQELQRQSDEWQARLTQLVSDSETRLREAVRQAAADTARPLLESVRSAETAARRWRVVAVVEFVVVGVLSLVFALVPSR